LRRDSPTLLIYGINAVWGWVNFSFGPVVSLLRDEQHVTRGMASLHSVAFAAGAMVAGAVNPTVVRRVGRPATMWLGLAGASAMIIAFCAVRPLAATVSVVVGLSFFGTILLSGAISALGDHHGDAAPAALSEANAAGCATGVIAPMAVGAAVAAGWTWRPALAVVLLAFAALAAVAFFRGVRLPHASSSTVDSLAARPLPRTYWLVFAAMSLCGSVEVSTGLWAADFLRQRTGLSPADAAAAISAIVFGMLVGRVAGGRLALRFEITSLFLTAISVSLLGFVTFWLATTPVVGVAGLGVLGLGLALNYPLALSLQLRHSDSQPDLAASRSMYSAGIAFGAAPFALGALADAAGVRAAFLLIPLLLAGAACFVLLVRRYELATAVAVATVGDPAVLAQAPAA
jgi:fucose permease